MSGKSELRISTLARTDILEIAEYHRQQTGPASARRVYALIRESLERLRAYPLLGQIHPDPLLASKGFRKLVLTQTYVAVYKAEGDTVYVYRVVNGRTDYPKLLR